MSRAPVQTLVFDLGGVIIDWNPRHLYRKLFPGDDAAMESFLTQVCSPAWNAQQDAGRPFAEGIRALQQQHPASAELIAAYWERWEEMVPSEIPGAGALLRELRTAGMPLYALSNWSAETWPRAKGRFDVWDCFDGIVISGEIRLAKPDAAIFEHLLDRYALDAAATLFIDDSDPNVEAARRVGLQALRFTSVPALRAELAALGVACAGHELR